MLNVIWPIFIIASFIYAICLGNISEANGAIFTATGNAINLCMELLGTICFWNGIMRIAQETEIINIFKKMLKPILKRIFPRIQEGERVYSEISMNIIANIMGLGNAATPMGLKAMKSLQERNKDKEKLSDEMAFFIVLNTASIQIIPTTVIAIRNSLGSKNPTDILIPVWIATACAAIGALLATRIIIKKYR